MALAESTTAYRARPWSARRRAVLYIPARQRGSSPKLLVYNTALLTAQSALTPAEALADGKFRGRLVESAIGAHLLNAQAGGVCDLFYWRERNREVGAATGRSPGSLRSRNASIRSGRFLSDPAAYPSKNSWRYRSSIGSTDDPCLADVVAPSSCAD